MSEALLDDAADALAYGAAENLKASSLIAEIDDSTMRTALTALVTALAAYPEPVFHQVCLDARKAGRLPEVCRG